jgi:hypothetical protein
MRMRLRRASETIYLSGGDGSTILGCTYHDTAADGDTEKVTETIDVVLEGAAASVVANVRTIESWLEEAKAYQTGDSDDRIWLEIDLLDTDDWWRSEILSGMVSRSTSMRMLKAGQLLIGVQVTRNNWLEAYAETSVPISNGNGTDVTTGLPVFNCSDGAGASPAIRHNWVGIAANVIQGTIPAPARLELTNSYDSSADLGIVWVGHNWRSDPTNLAHVLEAEAASGGTAVDHAGSSGGQYKSVVVADGSEQTMLTWTLSTNLLNAARGRFFKIFMRRSLGIDTGMLYRLKLLDDTVTVWSGGQALVENSVRTINPIDVVQLPPWLPGQTGVRGMKLVLTGQRASTGSLTVYPDYLMLMALDSYREIALIGMGVEYGRRLIDDPIDGVYADDGSGGLRSGEFTPRGPGIWLKPLAAQRLFFLMHGNTILDGPISRSLSVVVKYRPRRLRL